MIETVSAPKWLAWLDSGIGLPPEPPIESGEPWRPDWDWSQILLGLYLAWLSVRLIDDFLVWRTSHASG